MKNKSSVKTDKPLGVDDKVRVRNVESNLRNEALVVYKCYLIDDTKWK